MLIAGVSFAPLEFPSVPLPHLEGAWMNSTREFLVHSRSQLVIPSLPTPLIFRVQDRHIMEMVITLNYTTGQMKQDNCCRLFFRVSRLSEIVALIGTSIHPIAWTGTERLSSHHDWPRQRRPRPSAWALWRRTLSKAFCQQPLHRILASSPSVLSTPLGAWHPSSRPFQLARWACFLDPILNRLFTPISEQNESTSYQVTSPLDSNMTHFISYDLTETPRAIPPVKSLPVSSIPVERIPQGPLVKVEKSRTPRALPTQTPIPNPQTFAEFCSALPPAELQLILHSHRCDSDSSLLPGVSDSGDSPIVSLYRRGSFETRRIARMGNHNRPRNPLEMYRFCFRMACQLIPFRRIESLVLVRLSQSFYRILQTEHLPS
jgi:hypothetical protein